MGKSSMFSKFPPSSKVQSAVNNQVAGRSPSMPFTPPAPPQGEQYQHVGLNAAGRPDVRMMQLNQLPPQIRELIEYQKQQNVTNALRAEEMGWKTPDDVRSKTPATEFFNARGGRYTQPEIKPRGGRYTPPENARNNKFHRSKGETNG